MSRRQHGKLERLCSYEYPPLLSSYHSLMNQTTFLRVTLIEPDLCRSNIDKSTTTQDPPTEKGRKGQGKMAQHQQQPELQAELRITIHSHQICWPVMIFLPILDILPSQSSSYSSGSTSTGVVANPIIVPASSMLESADVSQSTH